MERFPLFILCILLFTGVSELSAQAKFENDDYLIRQNNITAKQINHSKINSSEIYIHQVGSRNTISTYLNTEKSDVNYIQDGDYNNIYTNVTAKNFVSNIVQNGDRHKAFDFVNRPGQNVNLELNQQGNNHHFEKYGSNSIGNKMKFQMTGNSRSLIVRNFK